MNYFSILKTIRKKLFSRIAPKSLMARSLLIIVIPLVLIQVVTAFVFYERHWEAVGRKLANGLTGDISAVVNLIQAFPGEENHDWIFAVAEAHMHLKISVHKGTLSDTPAEPSKDLAIKALTRAMNDNIHYPFLLKGSFQDRKILIELQLPDMVMEIIVPKKRLFSTTTYVFVIWTIGASLLLFIVAMLFMRNQVRPVIRLARAANLFGKGQKVANFKPEGATEVRKAAKAFMVMRDRIKAQINERTKLLAGVSHDLRTPLTRMKLALAMMGNAEEVEGLKEDVSDMEHMVEGYLSFARGDGQEKTQDIKIDELLEDIIDRFKREGAEIDFNIEEKLEVPLRPNSFGRCISNIVSNALRYGNNVAVKLEQRNNAIELIVEDDGPGIPLEKRKEVFDAFVRLEDSRNPMTGGVGLGLTIARDIISGHGGKIFLEDSPLGGLKVRLVLPL
ncbi:MAG: two-component sensor histidine kinase [Alphaproteobacteria bacterium]|nr:two-component sensor histidine kinase [Alphaproteobacteria bacterium]